MWYANAGAFAERYRVYTPDELSMVTMPVLVMAGGKPILYKNPDQLAAAPGATPRAPPPAPR
jgi:hypothetical protein